MGGDKGQAKFRSHVQFFLWLSTWIRGALLDSGKSRGEKEKREKEKKGERRGRKE